MNRCHQNPILVFALFFAIVVSCVSLSQGQVKKDPPESPVSGPGVQEEFVPQADPETRLTPINPRPILDRDSESGLQPIVPDRTDLRSIIDGIDNWADDQPNKNVAVSEIIRQRYPDGKVQLMREVAQDKAGNYYNHGEWKLFNRKGQTLAEGRFVEGVMDGVWRRWHPESSGGIFSSQPFSLFAGPFLSVASFHEGDLNGVWTLYDHFDRKIFEIPYQAGVRQGTATWWYPNNTKMRKVTFKQGLMDGRLLEWNDQDKLTRQDEYIEGKKIIRQTTFYRPNQKLTENFFLDSKMEPTGQDDWWQARPAKLDAVGAKIQHGPALVWHDNGQLKMKGQYKDNVRVGRFTWWHPNGQKQLAGAYDENGNKIGSWTWWHANGFKSILGEYEIDVAANDWVWWDENGQVNSRENLSERANKEVPSFDSTNDSEDEFRDPTADPTSQPNDSADSTKIEIPVIEEPDDLKGLEEIQPFGEGEIDLLPEKTPDEDEG